jgi:hypothetical protein
MDLKQYFRKLREIEAGIKEPYVMVSSLETSDGGKAGTISEVSRAIAAKSIAEGRAMLATEQEAKLYAEKQLTARHAAEKAALASRLQVAIVTEPVPKSETPAVDRNSVSKK